MVVTCDSCKTKFNLDASRLKAAGQKVRCSRCGHIFTVFAPQEQILPQIDLLDEPPDLEDTSPVPPQIPRTPPHHYLSRKRSAFKSFFLWVIPLLLLAGGIFWLLSYSHSLFSAGSGVPKKASSPSSEHFAVTILDSTQAYFLENVNAGQIFVVQGEVTNESNKPASFILLEGKLFTTDNRVAQSQRCFCGNVMSREELTRLHVTEMQNRMMNREGEDLKNVHVPPGGRVPFMIVFHNLPELGALSDYSIEVISAETD